MRGPGRCAGPEPDERWYLWAAGARGAGSGSFPPVLAPREGHRGRNFIWVFGLRFNCSVEGDIFAMRDTGLAKLLSPFEGVATKPVSSSSVREISMAKQTCRMSKPSQDRSAAPGALKASSNEPS